MINHTIPEAPATTVCRQQIAEYLHTMGDWIPRSKLGEVFDDLSRHALSADLRVLVREGRIERKVATERVPGERYPRSLFRAAGK